MNKRKDKKTEKKKDKDRKQRKKGGEDKGKCDSVYMCVYMCVLPCVFTRVCYHGDTVLFQRGGVDDSPQQTAVSDGVLLTFEPFVL